LSNSVPKTAEELKHFFRYLDQILIEQLREKLKDLYRSILEAVDKVIADHRSPELRIEHLREVWYQTCLGEVRVKRRIYRDKTGQRRCLLDELMGLGKYQHKTLRVQELALDLVSQMPYRSSAEMLQQMTAIEVLPQTLWRLVQAVGGKWLQAEERQLEWFQQTGELPPSEEKQVACLLTEVDGVILPLQREQERRIEVKVGIAYEGWQKVGRQERYRTVNKTIYCAVGQTANFLDGLSLKLHRRYDLAGIPHLVVGGDGAGWIRSGADYFRGRFQLDRYHLQKELRSAYGRDSHLQSQIWQACERGEVNRALSLITASKTQAKGDQRERIEKLYGYINDNAVGLGDYRWDMGEKGKDLRRTGAMEGNIDKLVVRRMKNQGMSWSIQGLRSLLCIRFLARENKLSDWLGNWNWQASKPIIAIPRRQARKIVTRLSSQEPDQWLKASLPVLRGPHADRPWVIALKSLSGGTMF
jgi:hypothetical protein